MKDQELYHLIKKAVKQRKKMPHHSQTLNFAERYCQDQLKKKLGNNRCHEKMGTLMKKFNRLQTYFDLPVLINDIRRMKSREFEDQKIKSCKNLHLKSLKQIQLKNLASKNYVNYKNWRHAIENQTAKNLIQFIQNQNQWKSEALKNNSTFHMSAIDRGLEEERDTVSLHQSYKMFENLQNFLKNQKDFIENEQKLTLKRMKMNNSQKKQEKDFLHKVSSYLQIILQKQHKSKWNRKRKSSTLNIFQGQKLIASKSEHHKVQNKRKLSPQIKNMSNFKHRRDNKENQKKNQEKTNSNQESQSQNKKLKSRFFTEDIQKRQENIKSQYKQCKTLGQRHVKQQQYPLLLKRNSNAINQKFTFRRRSVKQRIINKLDKFIGSIDDESVSIRNENGYYSNEINKLQTHFKKLYGRYRKQTLANDKQIEDIKKAAQQFSMITPNGRVSAGHGQLQYDNWNSTPNKLQSKQIASKLMKIATNNKSFFN